MRSWNTRVGVLCALLAILCIAAYWRYPANSFLTYRDDVYVMQIIHLQVRLSPMTCVAALGNDAADLWHPFAFIAHTFDYQLFGNRPAGHHWMNILLHAANAILLFLLFWRMTHAIATSLLVAVLFTVHPLQVDTVAWIAQRKTILGLFFGLLALHAYVSYVQSGGKIRYLLMFVMTLFAFFSSPALLTLPIVMLLLDVWPLRRADYAKTFDPDRPGDDRSQNWRGALLEKIPLFLFAVVVAAPTVLILRGSIAPEDILPFGQRVGLAVMGYVTYLTRMFWPRDLAVEYPVAMVSAWNVFLAGAFLLVTTVAVILARNRRPYLFVGWLWYLVALAPMSGLFQFEEWSTADRLTYWPVIGIFLAVSWLLGDLCRGSVIKGAVAGGVVAIVVLALTVSTWNRAEMWRDSGTLFETALAVEPDYANFQYRAGVLHGDSGDYEKSLEHFQAAARLKPHSTKVKMALARALIGVGKTESAIEVYSAIIAANPGYADAYIGRGLALAVNDRYEEAIYNYQAALDLKSESSELYSNLGIAYSKKGDLKQAGEWYLKAITTDPLNSKARIGYGTVFGAAGDFTKAIEQFRVASVLDPTSAEPILQMGIVLAREGKVREAEEQFRAAIERDPTLEQARVSLALLLVNSNRDNEAVAVLEELLKQAHKSPSAAFLLAGTFVKIGQVERGIHEYRAAINARQDWPEALNALAWLLATHPDEKIRNGFEAVLFAERANRLTNQSRPVFLDTLAAAYAEDGKFDDAVRTEKRAIDLAKLRNNDSAALEMEQRLKLYQSQQKYRRAPDQQKDT